MDTDNELFPAGNDSNVLELVKLDENGNDDKNANSDVVVPTPEMQGKNNIGNC